VVLLEPPGRRGTTTVSGRPAGGAGRRSCPAANGAGVARRGLDQLPERPLLGALTSRNKLAAPGLPSRPGPPSSSDTSAVPPGSGGRPRRGRRRFRRAPVPVDHQAGTDRPRASRSSYPRPPGRPRAGNEGPRTGDAPRRKGPPSGAQRRAARSRVRWRSCEADLGARCQGRHGLSPKGGLTMRDAPAHRALSGLITYLTNSIYHDLQVTAAGCTEATRAWLGPVTSTGVLDAIPPACGFTAAPPGGAVRRGGPRGCCGLSLSRSLLAARLAAAAPVRP